MLVHLGQDATGVYVKHKGRVLTRTYLNKSGMSAASAIAYALKLRIPPEGEVLSTVVSTGVIYRVLAISELNFNNPLSFELASKLIEEAHSLQGSSSIEA